MSDSGARRSAATRMNELPVQGGPQKRPAVRQLIEAFKRCSPWSGAGWNRVRHNEDVRFMRWPGQWWDCKKRGSSGKPAFPWQEASDQRCPVADDIINGIVAECVEAFWRAWLSPKAGMTEVSNYAVKLADHFVNAWANEALAVQVERSAQYRETYGWVPLHARWETEIALEYRTLSLEELVAAGQRLMEMMGEESGALTSAATGMMLLPELILDPEREAEAVEVLQMAYGEYARQRVGPARVELPGLRDARVRRAVRELRETGRAELPVPYVCRNQPAVYALKPWEEFFLTNNCADVQEGMSFRVDWLSEVSLRAKGLSEDWDKGWIEEAVKHKGKFSAWNIAASVNETLPSGELSQAMSATGNSVYELTDLKQDLIEVVYCVYRLLDEDDVPGVYLTIVHPNVGAVEGQVSAASSYAWHGLLRDARGKVPFVIGKREELGPAITSSRGVPEICNSWQRVIKSQTDGTVDWTSLGVLPPINEYANAMGTEYKYGPAVKNTVVPGREPSFMEVPTKGVPVAFEMLQYIERKVAKYFGEPHPDLAERDGAAKRNKTVGSFLMLWTGAIEQVLELCQANMEDAEFARITGAPEGWLDGNRNRPGLLGGPAGGVQLEFDIRELDPEYVGGVMKTMNEAVIPADVGGVINRTKWSRVQMRMLNPRLSRELVTEEGDASKAMFDRVKTDVALMFVGQEAEYVEMDPAAKAKLGYLTQVIEANPNYGYALRHEPKGRFMELLDKYARNLQFSLTQEQNKQVGRIGVTSDGMERGSGEAGEV